MFGGKPFASAGPFSTQTTSSIFSSQAKPSVSFGGGGGLFGSSAAPTTTIAGTGGLFGIGTTTTAAAGGGLFGSGQAKPLFGGSAGGGAFGTAATTTGGLFGGTAGAATSGGLFAATAATTTGGLFGSSMTSQAGTVVKFEPPIANDTMMKNNMQQNIQTKHQCITAMKQYEGKSLEELRVEDYLANRRGAQQQSGFLLSQPQTSVAGSTLFSGGTSLFPSTTQQKPSLFSGSTGNTGLFGTTSAAPTSGAAAGGLFGSSAAQNKPLFGSTAGGGLFGSTAQTSTPSGTTSLFGQQQKPSGLFGSTAVPQTSTPSFSLFGQHQPQTQPVGLFGVAKPAFPSPAVPSTGLFGSTPATSTGGGLFGAKPAAAPFSGFGATTNTAGSLFAGSGTTGGLFGSSANTQAKPGGLFGQPQTTSGGGLFGQTATSGGLFGAGAAAKPPGFSFAPSSTGGFGTAGGGLFGNTTGSTIGVAPSAPITCLGTDPNQAAAQQALFQSQLLSYASSPYGSSPLLKLIGKGSDSPQAPYTSPTDPLSQQKALRKTLQGANKRHSLTAPPVGSFSPSNIATAPRMMKMNFQPNSLLLMSPLGQSTSFNKSKNTSLLETEESGTALLKQGFVPKKSVKHLVLPPRRSDLKRRIWKVSFSILVRSHF